MIAYSYIKNNLEFLDRKFRQSSSIKDANYCSKMAILELCGWLELSIDDMVLRACNRSIKDAPNVKILQNRVKRNYGFEYERHFMSLVVSIVGLRGFEAIESNISMPTIVNFKNELENLKERRNSLAHTYFRGTTVHYDAPSTTIGRYNVTAAGLRAYDEALRNYC